MRGWNGEECGHPDSQGGEEADHHGLIQESWSSLLCCHDSSPNLLQSNKGK